MLRAVRRERRARREHSATRELPRGVFSPVAIWLSCWIYRWAVEESNLQPLIKRLNVFCSEWLQEVRNGAEAAAMCHADSSGFFSECLGNLQLHCSERVSIYPPLVTMTSAIWPVRSDSPTSGLKNRGIKLDSELSVGESRPVTVPGKPNAGEMLTWR